MAHDVFISHSSKDKSIADAVCSILEQNKIRCWIAPRDILPGQDYAEGIMNGISECCILVLIFSQNSNTSKHVLREIERAANYDKILIPFRIEDVIPTKSMEYWLSTPHWIDAITPKLEKHILKLAGRCRAIISQEKMSNDSIIDETYNQELSSLNEEKELNPEETAKLEVEKQAEEAARLEEEKRQAEETARLEEDKRQSEEVARLEEEKRKAEEALRLEEERRKAEEAAQFEADIKLYLENQENELWKRTVKQDTVEGYKEYLNATKLKAYISKASENISLTELSEKYDSLGDAEKEGFLNQLIKASEHGNPKAQYMLGKMYADGRSIIKDETKAAEWYAKSAEQGHAKAQCNLGYMYNYGKGVIKDETKAVEWYKKSAEQGHAIAQCNLGKMYADGKGIIKNEAKALEWYRKSAEQGNSNAQCNLGYMYEYGKGMLMNEVKAVEWYRKSAEQGNAAAQCNLGNMYFLGRGITKDQVKAAEWHRKSADQGYALAQYALGNMYASGAGVTKDTAAAIEWYKKASKGGIKEADEKLKAINLPV